MNWIILTILAILSRAIYGISTKVLSSNVKVSPVTQSFIWFIYATILAIITCPFLGGFSLDHVFANRWIVLIMILCATFGNVVYYKGIKSLDSSTAQIGFSSILIWGVIFSTLFLGSKFSIIQLFGICILLSAIVLAQLQNKKIKLAKGILFMFLSAAFFSMVQITSAELVKTVSTGMYLLMVYLGPLIATGLLYFRQIKSDFPQQKNNFLHTNAIMLLSTILNTFYYVLAYLAYRVAPDRGIVVILLTSQVVLAVILSVIFLKEKEGILRKVIAGLLAVLAGILIKG